MSVLTGRSTICTLSSPTDTGRRPSHALSIRKSLTHRFTPGSKEVLKGWYPNTTLDLDEANRARKFNKFGGVKYVYPRDMMGALRGFFEREIATKLPMARILYWT